MDITNRSSFAKDYVCMGTYVDVWQILDRFHPPHPPTPISLKLYLCLLKQNFCFRLNF